MDTPKTDDALEGIEWTTGLEGHQDLHASLLRLSTRYYPRGGACGLQPGVRPSARALIYWRWENKYLVKALFEAETEAAVKAQVESWARAVLTHLRSVIEKAIADGPLSAA